METKDYTIIGLSIALIISLGFNSMPDSTHKCDSRELTAYCFDMSPTGKTCYTLPDKTGGKRCTEGWKEISIPQHIESEEYNCVYNGCYRR